MNTPPPAPVPPPGDSAAPRRPTGVVTRQAVAEAERLESRGRWDRRVRILLLLLLLLAILPTAAWHLTPPREARLVILDKTVPHQRWVEHGALVWWLDHHRRTTRADAPWQLERDYVGFDPATQRGTYLDSASLAGARLLYIADAYGVYTGDYADSARRAPDHAGDSTSIARTRRAVGTPPDSLRAALDHSRRIFGGVTPAEAAAIERFQQRGGAVVAEFNTLETPTWNTAASPILARVLGATYEGWLGRWYGDLASPDEIPRWMKDRWRRVHGRAWDFEGEGLVVFSEIDDRLVVLEASHFTREHPVTVELDDPADPLVRAARGGQPYWYWFAGIAPTADGVVLASFTLHVDSAARATLAASGFPSRFPALVRRRALPLGAYLAGDFADVGESLPRWRHTSLIDPIRRYAARRSPRRGRAGAVFWNFVMPVWGAALEISEKGTRH